MRQTFLENLEEQYNPRRTKRSTEEQQINDITAQARKRAAARAKQGWKLISIDFIPVDRSPGPATRWAGQVTYERYLED